MEKEERRSVKHAKRTYEKKLAKEAKKNPKEFYSYLKSKTQNRESVGPLKSPDSKDEVVIDDAKMASMLNEFFSSVLFTQEDLSNLPTPETMYHGDSPLNDVEITSDKVKKKINGMRTTAAPGPDRLCPRLLMEVCD